MTLNHIDIKFKSQTLWNILLQFFGCLPLWRNILTNQIMHFFPWIRVSSMSAVSADHIGFLGVLRLTAENFYGSGRNPVTVGLFGNNGEQRNETSPCVLEPSQLKMSAKLVDNTFMCCFGVMFSHKVPSASSRSPPGPRRSSSASSAVIYCSDVSGSVAAVTASLFPPWDR